MFTNNAHFTASGEIADSPAVVSSKIDKRAKEILRLLLHHGRTSVDELTGILKMSPASVRRDLVRLEERGLVHRTHGGAMLAGQAVYEPFRFDAAFGVREERFAKEKQRIAQAAADLIEENETIGITAGTTTTQVAQRLRHRNNLHIITNAVNIAMEMSNSAGIDTTLTGGRMRWQGAFSLIGPAATESLNVVVMDRVFVGVCGVDPERGATTIEADEAAVFRAMTRQAKQVVVVADSSKVGMVSPVIICPSTTIDVLITDDGIPDDAVAAFEKAGVKVLSV
ncbi:MAG: DeoR/GlpR family DNA-binding transcription regulator [Acidobacteriaceae bacterium]